MAVYKQPDFWTRKAHTEGYPARSVYKLQELDEKFHLLPRNAAPAGEFRVLDLGAAPGSWSLYVLRRLGNRCHVTAVDLGPLSRQYDRGLFSGGNFCFVQGDLMAPETQAVLGQHGPFHLILSDAAPGTTGTPGVDALRSAALGEAALGYTPYLVKGGSLVLKVFQSAEAPLLLKAMQQQFATVKGFKPKACRRESVEIYYVGAQAR